MNSYKYKYFKYKLKYEKLLLGGMEASFHGNTTELVETCDIDLSYDDEWQELLVNISNKLYTHLINQEDYINISEEFRQELLFLGIKNADDWMRLVKKTEYEIQYWADDMSEDNPLYDQVVFYTQEFLESKKNKSKTRPLLETLAGDPDGRFKVVMLINKLKKKGSTQRALNNEDEFVSKYNNDREYRKTINNFLNIDNDSASAIKPTKEFLKQFDNENHNQLKHTDLWTDLKHGTSEKYPTAKTDVVIINNENLIGISIKSGKGRLTSADYYESKAIFMSVFNNKYSSNERIRELLNILFNNDDCLFESQKITIPDRLGVEVLQKYIEGDKTLVREHTPAMIGAIEWMETTMVKNKEANYLWHLLCTEFPNFCLDVLEETLTGEYKFGENIGRADHLLVFEGCTTSVKQHINLNTKIDSNKAEVNAYVVSELTKKSPFHYKSGGYNQTKNHREAWIIFL